MEDEISRAILASVSRDGGTVVASLFDGAIAQTATEIHAFDNTRDLIREKYGVNVCANPIAPDCAVTNGENDADWRKLDPDGRYGQARYRRYPKLNAVYGGLREGADRRRRSLASPQCAYR